MNLKSFLLAFGLLGTSGVAATATACSCSAKEDTTDQEVVNAINSYKYEDETVQNTKYTAVLASVNQDFVKVNLSTDLRTKFKDSNFKLLRITDPNDTTKELTDADFTGKPNETKVQAKFIYNYGKFTEQTADIIFPIINSEQQEVINAINSITYSRTVNINTLYNNLKTQIADTNYKFIQDGLQKAADNGEIDALIPGKFVGSKFQLFSITNENWIEMENKNLEQFTEMDVKLNYGYYTVENETTNLHLKVIALNESDVVNEINQVSDYQYTIPVKSRYGDLKFDITPAFIKDKLTTQQPNFNENAIHINSITDENGVELTDADFQTVRPLNIKINYDYGLTKNQNTNLALNIEKMHLDVELKGFRVRDRKNVVGYLNGNLGSILRDQIKDYLAIPDFEGAGLEFVNQTSNSIDVRAKESSEEYQGQITLTWNLKLFEVWGLGISGEPDNDYKNGLKGYFYLESGTNKVKYFDVYGFMVGKTAEIHHYQINYHRFTFRKNTAPIQTKDFTFNGTWYTNTIADRFGSFDFVPGMTVTINSPEANRIKFFNPNTAEWNDTLTGRTYTFNSLGQITTIPKF